MSFSLSEKSLKALGEIKSRYPKSKSAVMPALYLVQEELGMINEEAINLVAELLDYSPIHVKELVTFYTMYYAKPVGKYHFQVCRTLSCALRGSKDITQTLKDKFGINPHEVTEDGLFSYEQVECLGSCGTAPMCEINDTYFENLTSEKLLTIIDRIEKEQPDLRFSTSKDKLGEGFSDLPKSEIMED
ncbi:UNVERIFIED_CONTAM: hypothetical protein GTU68_027804 [Idotea baltica]|nr:hypothetical protein [Idotea baltica]